MSQAFNFSDQEISEYIHEGGEKHQDIAVHLFHHFRGFISKVIQKLHINEEEANDAYADSIVKLLRKIKEGSFRGDSKISTYFYKIYYNACVDVLRKNASNDTVQITELTEYSVRERYLLDKVEVDDRSKQVKLLIQKMGDSCKQILIDWGYYGFPMEEIAIRSNLNSAESARSMKYKCLKKLKKMIAENS